MYSCTAAHYLPRRGLFDTSQFKNFGGLSGGRHDGEVPFEDAVGSASQAGWTHHINVVTESSPLGVIPLLCLSAPTAPSCDSR